MYQSLRRLADGMAVALALAGGVILIAIIALTCLSIVARALVPLDIGIGTISGIYDLTEIGMAAAIFAFLPLAQMRDAHAKVDLFQTLMPRRVDLMLDLVFSIGMAVVAGIGAWRLFLGMLDKLSYGETTLIAQIPVWQGYAGGLVGALGFVLVAAFCVLRAARRVAGIEDEERADVQL